MKRRMIVLMLASLLMLEGCGGNSDMPFSDSETESVAVDSTYIQETEMTDSKQDFENKGNPDSAGTEPEVSIDGEDFYTTEAEAEEYETEETKTEEAETEDSKAEKPDSKESETEEPESSESQTITFEDKVSQEEINTVSSKEEPVEEKPSDEEVSNEEISREESSEAESSEEITSEEELPEDDPVQKEPTQEETPKDDLQEEESSEENSQESEIEAAFDITYWISFAKDYATRRGFILDETAIDCWDNPITASARSKYLERDIKSRLDYYMDVEGYTSVWIWYEEVGENAYRLYVGYA